MAAIRAVLWLALSEEERGEVKPAAAVVNLFRLLDRYPDLLNELKKRKAA
jgi:hypothetical protein